MKLHISLEDGTPVYRQIVHQIRYRVASGLLRSGERLPPVRGLAESLLINPNTVARAYRELESEGTLEGRRGAGVFVRAGASPFALSEKRRILSERIDLLLAESKQLDVSHERLLALIEERRDRLLSAQEEDLAKPETAVR